METSARPEAERYLRTKRYRMGHVLALDVSPSEMSTQPLASSHATSTTPALTIKGDRP